MPGRLHPGRSRCGLGDAARGLIRRGYLPAGSALWSMPRVGYMFTSAGGGGQGPARQSLTMAEQSQIPSRREFVGHGLRGAFLFLLGAATSALARHSQAKKWVWQIDPYKCVWCTNCATSCVLQPSAVKCVQVYPLCGASPLLASHTRQLRHDATRHTWAAFPRGMGWLPRIRMHRNSGNPGDTIPISRTAGNRVMSPGQLRSL